jgi:hypothetical protein
VRDAGRLLTSSETRPTRRWTPSPAESAALRRQVGAPDRMLTFDSDGHFAVLLFASPDIGRGKPARAVIARLEGDWHIEWDSRKARVHCGMFELPAAIDLDGDGRAEVILRRGGDAVYDDIVLRRDGAGWKLVAESYPGNSI